MNDDYIELTDPEEVIRDGDRVQWPDGALLDAKYLAGKTLGKTMFRKIRRPRSTVIRETAEALLRAIEKRLDGSKPIIEPELSKLREALGLTIEELRGDA